MTSTKERRFGVEGLRADEFLEASYSVIGSYMIYYYVGIMTPTTENLMEKNMETGLYIEAILLKPKTRFACG